MIPEPFKYFSGKGLSHDDDKVMAFRYTWVYSKEDTMAHTRRLVVIS